jgi:muconolactone delta-isomerase
VKHVKFLVIEKVKREVPMEKWARLLPLQFKYFSQLEKQGSLEVDYHLIGQQGSMLILNVDSDEALSRVIGEDPMFFHMDREVYPLTTRENHEKQIKQLFQKE